MSEKYKVHDQERPYFITFAVENWIDVFTRQQYKDIIIESLQHCQKQKGLIIYSYCLMSNHIPTRWRGSYLRDFLKTYWLAETNSGT